MEPKAEESKKINLAPEDTPEDPSLEAIQSEPIKKKNKKGKMAPVVVEEKPKKGKKSKTISSTRREAYGL